MKEFIWVKCESCGYSNRVFLMGARSDDPIELVIEASGWAPSEPDGERQTWICETCAKQ